MEPAKALGMWTSAEFPISLSLSFSLSLSLSEKSLCLYPPLVARMSKTYLSLSPLVVKMSKPHPLSLSLSLSLSMRALCSSLSSLAPPLAYKGSCTEEAGTFARFSFWLRFRSDYLPTMYSVLFLWLIKCNSCNLCRHHFTAEPQIKNWILQRMEGISLWIF